MLAAKIRQLRDQANYLRNILHILDNPKRPILNDLDEQAIIAAVDDGDLERVRKLARVNDTSIEELRYQAKCLGIKYINSYNKSSLLSLIRRLKCEKTKQSKS